MVTIRSGSVHAFILASGLRSRAGVMAPRLSRLLPCSPWAALGVRLRPDIGLDSDTACMADC